MKKKLLFFALLLLFFITTAAYAVELPKVFIVNKEVPNNGEYIIKDNSIYVNENALKRDLGINAFYEKDENKITIYPVDKMQLQARCEMFEEFATLFNPSNPDEVAKFWAKGVKNRNGVLQYVVLNKSLKDEFAKSIEQSWVTGTSSPWIENYTISKEKVNPSLLKYNIAFNATTSAKDKYTWNAVLTVGKEDNKWRVVKLQKDF